MVGMFELFAKGIGPSKDFDVEAIKESLESDDCDITGLNSSGETVLHVAIMWNEIEVEIIDRLLVLWPHAAQVVCRNGSLPLHLYCAITIDASDVRVLRSILAAFPDATKTTKFSATSFLGHQLPIEIAMRAKNSETFEFLWDLASAVTRADILLQWAASLEKVKTKRIYKGGNTSLHHVIWAHKVSEHVLFVLQTCPEAVWTLNDEGQCPLDIALLNRYPSERVIREILRKMIDSTCMDVRTETDSSGTACADRRKRVLCLREKMLWNEVNWRSRREVLLMAKRLFNGKYFSVLSQIARFV